MFIKLNNTRINALNAVSITVVDVGGCSEKGADGYRQVSLEFATGWKQLVVRPTEGEREEWTVGHGHVNGTDGYRITIYPAHPQYNRLLQWLEDNDI